MQNKEGIILKLKQSYRHIVVIMAGSNNLYFTMDSCAWTAQINIYV